jgi:SAM-dependent methyltransferase
MDISDFVIDECTVRRYRLNYGLGADINANHVAKHLRLENELTNRLLVSSPKTRWKTFHDCYTILYRELPWLNEIQSFQDNVVEPELVGWSALIGGKSKIFEVGSGRAKLLRYLMSIGHSCVATEITPERGSKHLDERDGLLWHNTDGVHLAEFEERESYDFVISTQLIEHLHPDDLMDHFRNAKLILKPGGEYIFDTPHRGAGPHDLSLVFRLDQAAFMHLREYTFVELTAALRAAGFKNVRAIFARSAAAKPHRSALYLQYCMLWDRVLSALRLHPRTENFVRTSWKVRTRLLVPSNIWLSAAA